MQSGKTSGSFLDVYYANGIWVAGSDGNPGKGLWHSGSSGMTKDMEKILRYLKWKVG
jgi:hypothetical protein